MTPLWQLQIPGFDVPVHSGDLLITQELTNDRRGIQGLTAVHLPTRTVAWRLSEPPLPADMHLFGGYEAYTYENRIIHFDRVGGLKVRDQTGRVLREIAFPADIPRPIRPLGKGHRMQVAGNLLIMPLKQDVLAYDLRSIAQGSGPLEPVWRRTHPKEGERYFGIDNLHVDAASTTVAYSLTGSDEIRRTTDTTLYVADASTGQTRWTRELFQSQETPNIRRGEVGVGDGVIVTHVGGQAYLRGFDLGGKELYRTEDFYCPGGTTNIYLDVMVQNGRVYPIPFGDACISAWNAQTGKKEWVFGAPLGGTFAQRPLFLRGVVYSANGYVWALDERTGQVLGRSQQLARTQDVKATPMYDAPRDQVLVWGEQLTAFRPLR